MNARSTFYDQKFLKTVGAYLKEKRINNGLSQKQVSRHLGFSTPQFVSVLERGRAAPPLVVVTKLMSLYKIDRNEMYVIYKVNLARVLQRIFSIDSSEM